MGAWRGEYSFFEMEQMALCLLGTPLAAFLLGCVARALNPRLNVARCMVVGLFFAAGFGLICFVPFAAWVLTTRGSGSTRFLQIFDGMIGLRFPIVAIFVAMFGAGVVTVSAARFRKVGEDDPQTGGRVNLRQLFLLQLLPFVVLGSWMGMRSVALSSVSEFERASRKWVQRGWDLKPDEQGGPAKLMLTQKSYFVDDTEHAAYLIDASREPWLTQLNFGLTRAPDRLGFSSFSKTPSLKGLSIFYDYGSFLSPSHLQALGQITSLEELELKSGGCDGSDMTPIAKLPKLGRFSINTMAIAPSELNKLTQSGTIEFLFFYDVTTKDLSPIRFPTSVTELSLHTRYLWTLDRENFKQLTNLRKLTMHISGITKQEIDAIAQAPNLEEISLHGVSDPADLESLAATPQLKHLQFWYLPVLGSADQSCEKLLQKLALHPNLQVIECDPKFLMGWGSLDEDADLLESVTREPDGTTVRSLGQVGMRKRVERRMPKFQAMVDQVRREKGLEKLEIKFFPFSTMSIPYSKRVAYVKPNVRGGRP